MRTFYLIIFILFIGCASNQTATKIKQFASCYVKRMPAPYWVCYQSSFEAIGKVHSKKLTRLKQEEAFNIGITALAEKLKLKTKLFLIKLGVEDKSILKKVKSFVIMNAIEDGTWYSKKEEMVYVRVRIDKEEFKRFLFKNFKMDKKLLEIAFDETF